jgi:DNA-binding NtrC family response regulator
MSQLPQLLICDDDTLFHMSFKQALKSKFEIKTAYNGDEALAIVKTHNIDVILLDIHLRSPDEGLRFIPKLLAVDPEVSIVMNSSSTDFLTVREAMKLGAVDYVAKDFASEELFHTLNQVLERRRILKRQEQQNYEAVHAQRQHLLVGASRSISTLRNHLEKIRNSPANVLIAGETGTGKEVIARQLRKSLPTGELEPFIAVDSATIQSSMAESILFGHEKGAFTGADRISKGIFEEAHGGVVYFDEISNMPLSIQAKLLRVLQEKEVTRLGSSKVIKLDFRVICATNKDLEKMAQEGTFKDDLLQRLNVIPILLPPLRERVEDIPALVEHFISRQSFRTDSIHFSKDCFEALKAYSWPGNIRELGNLISYLLTMVENSEIEVADLPPKFRDAIRAAASQPLPQALKAPEYQSFYQQVSEFESTMLKREYDRFQGNVSQLALALGMDRSHLYTKLKEYGIHQSRKG